MLFKALDIAHRWSAIQSTNQIKPAGFGKLRIRFERSLDIHKALLVAGGCCNFLGTPGSRWSRSAPLLGRSQTVLRPFSGRSLVVLGPLSRREVVRAVQSGRFNPFRLPHTVCQHRELADEMAL